mmetsp:Transcript_31832/g.38510  ORF Transcript_31832/g.38510 Transcript_31832/m.38510 type:complete len:217 (-) Transcript_31832:1217-1867(-)
MSALNSEHILSVDNLISHKNNFLNLHYFSHLVQADHLPPDSADTEPNSDVEDGQNASKSPPLGQRDVASAVERRRRPNTIVSCAAHKVAEACEENGRDDGRASACNSNGEECSVHGTNVGGTGGEHVVGVEVDEANDHQSGLPCQPETSNHLHYFCREPADKPVLVEVCSHSNQGSEPCEGIPCTSLSQTFLPCHHSSHQQHSQTNEGGSHRPNTE